MLISSVFRIASPPLVLAAGGVPSQISKKLAAQLSRRERDRKEKERDKKKEKRRRRRKKKRNERYKFQNLRRPQTSEIEATGRRSRRQTLVVSRLALSLRRLSGWPIGCPHVLLTWEQGE